MLARESLSPNVCVVILAYTRCSVSRCTLLSILLKSADLFFQGLHVVFGVFYGRRKAATFSRPASDSIALGDGTTYLGVNFLTEATFGINVAERIDQLRATSLTDSIFTGTMLSEMAPFEVPTRETQLIIEAHFSLGTR